MFKILILSISFLTIGQRAHSQSQEQVYAGVILHIMKYVEWPSYDADMTVGVVNNPLLVKALQKASTGKKIHFKNVKILRFSDMSMLKGVDVLFFSKKVLKGLSPEVVKSSGKGVLVITELGTKVTKGVAINFVQKNGNLQFEIYSNTIVNQGFKVSDQLKKLAILK